MLLVPRQLQRSGMTGSVPYYGGRFTPSQAWAAAHPTAPPLGSLTGTPPDVGPRAPVPLAPPPVAQPATPARDPDPATIAALQQLRDTGVITDEEYAAMLRRAGR